MYLNVLSQSTCYQKSVYMLVCLFVCMFSITSKLNVWQTLRINSSKPNYTGIGWFTVNTHFFIIGEIVYISSICSSIQRTNSGCTGKQFNLFNSVTTWKICVNQLLFMSKIKILMHFSLKNIQNRFFLGMKSSKWICILLKLKLILTKEIVLYLFKSFFQQFIRYGSEIWFSTCKKYTNKIFVLQKKNYQSYMSLTVQSSLLRIFSFPRNPEVRRKFQA